MARHLRAWVSAPIPTRSELRTGLLAAGVVFLVIVALAPVVGWLAR